MSSAFPGGGPDFYGGGGGRSSIGGGGGIGNNNLILPNNPSNSNTMNHQPQQHPRQALLRLQQQQQQLLQQQRQQSSTINGGGIMNDSIANSQIGGNRRPDFIGKRDFQNFSLFNQPASIQNQQHQRFSLLNPHNQNQNHPLSFLQQQQLYLRSVKQRTTNPPNNIIIPVNNNSNNTLVNYQNHGSPISSFDLRSSPVYQELSSSPSFSMPPADNTTTRYGVPVYQQHQIRPQQPISLITNNNNNDYSMMMRNNSNPLGPGCGGFVNNLGGGGVGRGTGTGGIVGGYVSNLGTNRVSSDESKPPESENSNNNNKILLQELEKQLLDDNDDEVEGDTVSVITNSEWSETFQNLMTQEGQATAITATAQPGGGQTQNNNQNNNNNNPCPSQNNMVSASPTSSTSSSCSSTAATVPAKQLISDSANAISEGKTESAVEILTRLSQLGNQTGISEQRMIYYMCRALRSRACPKEHPPAAVMELLGKDHMGSMYLFHDLSLCYKFGLFAANLVIMETISIAKQEKSNVHIIDFDIGHGGQYINLLRALGERHHQSQSQSAGAEGGGAGGGGGTCSVELKLTVVTTELMNSNSSGHGVDGTVKDMLLNTAEQAGVKLRLNAVNQSIHELTPESLGIEEENESLVVNFAFKLYRVPDESVSIENPRDELLRRVKGLKPRVVTLVEQDMNGNTAPFMTRVNECVAYYGALFDSLDCGPARDSPERLLVEEGLGRKMMNSLACEGRERMERCEVYGKWRARMGMAGFKLKPCLTQNVAESMKLKIDSSRVGDPRLTVKEENGGVCFGWMGRALTVASAWR